MRERGFKQSFTSMRRYAAPLISIVMVGLVLASFIWLKEYRPFGRIEPMPASPNVALRLENAELVGRSNGRMAWRFKARQVEVSQDRSETTFTDIGRGVVYDVGKPVVKLSARQMIYNSFTHDVTAIGAVQLTANEKLSVATDLLTWSGSQRKLFCPSRVTIDIGAGKGTAASLTADIAQDSLLLRQVNLKLPVKEDLIKAK
jgi:LPS export ABC transporter protein LptC